MTYTTNSPKYGWNEPTAQQQVSNRSIFRIQQLSDELKDQLNELPIFTALADMPVAKGKKIVEPVCKVFFVTRDERCELKQKNTKQDYTRWYNFRLCESYDFPERVRKWLKENGSEVDQFKCLFDAAKKYDTNAICRFDTFRQAVADPCDLEDDRRTAVDQIVMALAVLPYRGVLPEAFETAFELNSEKPPVTGCFHFRPTTKKTVEGDPVFAFTSFTHFLLGSNSSRTPIPMPKMQFHKDCSDQERLSKLFDGFLLPFTRGAKIKLKPKGGKSPYLKGEKDLTGFVVPAYDDWDGIGMQWLGGMAGWLVICLDQNIKVRAFFGENFKKNQWKKAVCEHSWVDFTHLLRTYVRRVREAHMRDLLEDYAEIQSNTSSRAFFEQHIHEVIGWGKSSILDTSIPDNDFSVTPLEIPLDATCGDLKLPVKKLMDTHWAQYTKCVFASGCRKGRYKSCSELNLERHRCWGPFPRGTRRLCKLFLEDMKLIDDQRQLGQLEGRMRVSHSIPYTISVHLNKLRAVAEKIAELRHTPTVFPIKSFNELPTEICSFKYPVELYSLAVENALLNPLDSDAFRRLMPAIDWIDEAITTVGISENLIRQIADSIARPLALISLQRADVVRRPTAPLQVTGTLAHAALCFKSTFEGRIFISVVIEFLREAFHHCEGSSSVVEVKLVPGRIPSLFVCNTCRETDVPSRLIGGNQNAMLNKLASHLSGWEILQPVVNNLNWCREIRRRV